ncbi:MAG TPA: hypothetical protein QF695_14170 [Arenicellales bacterium]|jgi:hypothetical protein|nr:hypothetical protein [Arenicellales bacterium]|tara:strand:- start:2110 stop:2340 length:231 start_codon:yes stop_codon:yes gene_type:complete
MKEQRHAYQRELDGALLPLRFYLQLNHGWPGAAQAYADNGRFSVFQWARIIAPIISSTKKARCLHGAKRCLIVLLA